MVIADCYIMCLEQKIPHFLSSDDFDISAQSIPIGFDPILTNEHLFAQHLNGIWYSFEPKEREFGIYSAEWFDLEIENHQNRVCVIEEHRETVMRIIDEYISLSPIKYVGILFRLEGSHRESVKGVMNKKQFLKQLFQNKIRYNCLYIIRQ